MAPKKRPSGLGAAAKAKRAKVDADDAAAMPAAGPSASAQASRPVGPAVDAEDVSIPSTGSALSDLIGLLAQADAEGDAAARAQWLRGVCHEADRMLRARDGSDEDDLPTSDAEWAQVHGIYGTALRGLGVLLCDPEAELERKANEPGDVEDWMLAAEEQFDRAARLDAAAPYTAQRMEALLTLAMERARAADLGARWDLLDSAKAIDVSSATPVQLVARIIDLLVAGFALPPVGEPNDAWSGDLGEAAAELTSITDGIVALLGMPQFTPSAVRMGARWLRGVYRGVGAPADRAASLDVLFGSRVAEAVTDELMRREEAGEEDWTVPETDEVSAARNALRKGASKSDVATLNTQASRVSWNA